MHVGAQTSALPHAAYRLLVKYTMKINLTVRPALLYAALGLVAGVVASSCSPAGPAAISAVTPLPANMGAAPSPTPMRQPAPGAAVEQRPATPTPSNLAMPPGSALAIAQATDAAMRPTPRQPLTFTESPVKLTFDEFYDGYNVRTGLALSDKLLSLDGQEVVIEGYMAPPLKAELDWFVLTRIRLSYCPFCSTAADWPDDIALIYLDGDVIRPTEKPLRLQGRLEVGPAVDPETGMVSIVRIYATQLETL